MVVVVVVLGEIQGEGGWKWSGRALSKLLSVQVTSWATHFPWYCLHISNFCQLGCASEVGVGEEVGGGGGRGRVEREWEGPL